MPDAAQYTLALFDSTARRWPTDLPAAATDATSNNAGHTSEISDESAVASRPTAGSNYILTGERQLARGWPARARDNVAAITLSQKLEESGRPATHEEQERLLRFIGFGATELAQNCFPLPGADDFRPGWEEIGESLAAATTPAGYAALKRATQYAHYTPEPIIRALWRAVETLGFTGGRVLEPGMGTGLFFALIPDALRSTTRLVGIEYDPITARIARLIHPEAHIRCEDYTRSPLAGGFDLAIGNPPFADRIVRGDPTTASLGLRLHDYFIARSISRLRPGGIALFVTSTGTMDKANRTGREHIASLADLIGAVRLPEGSMHATAGTDVVVDVIVFQRRHEGHAPAGETWINLREIPLDATAAPAPTGGQTPETMDTPSPAAPDAAEQPHIRPCVVATNEYFAAHPEMVLGEHTLRRGIYGPGLCYTCRARDNGPPIEALLDAALANLPTGIFIPSASSDESDTWELTLTGNAVEADAMAEGRFLAGKGGRLCEVINGLPVPVAIKKNRKDAGIRLRSAKIIQAMIPIRDAIRAILRAQAAGQPWTQHQIRLRCAYSTFIRYYGPINHTVITTLTDPETSEEREVHRRPNLAPFTDDPDCWLVASIEDYDLESGIARRGPIFDQRVISPPTTPLITSAADALAVTLNETGQVDPDRLGELLDCEPEEALSQLGTAVFRDPTTTKWETADAYLSGAVRTKLVVAEAAVTLDPQYERNVTALREAQPQDIPPSAITGRLGAPWIPTSEIETFSHAVMATETRIFHNEEVATWSVEGSRFIGSAAGTSEWGTPRRHAGYLLHDALNGATPQIFDTVIEGGAERRVLNPEATEAAKEKLTKIHAAFTSWLWTDPDRAERLSRLYNDRFNNLVPRHFDGMHLRLPGASNVIRLYEHQKCVIWRIISAGSTYVAHAVGAGKTFSIAAAIMEQKRLGLITKAMLVVPSHCLAQASREFLQLYPTARILVADEANFAKEKRARFLARAATAHWDAIIITHSAFRLIAVPAEFERQVIADQIATYETLRERADDEDRTTRKRIEAMKERLTDRYEAIKDRRDETVTIEEIGIDQLIIDEAQEFRKLSFATNRLNLKGVDPHGSQRAWDLYVKARFVAQKNCRRALIQASGTPITNTLGEMFTLLRFQNEAGLRERGVHEFDAWAAAFGDTRTELELQPSGAYKPVERFCQFVNVPELIDLFRASADVVLKDDLRQYLRLPRIKSGHRKLITAEPGAAFRDYQKVLANRITEIENRHRRVQKGDDILLAVITDGRHAAIDMRLVLPDQPDEPDNKLNKLIGNVHRIWEETARDVFVRPDGSRYPISGAGQLIFSDLGTLAVEEKRGFSAYRWIKQQLVRQGIPASEIAYMQDYKRSADKQRLFNDFSAGRVRILIGSSDTMGTGVNVQLRLKALHHLDVPWLPSQIEQREGRIERQGNQHDEIAIYAYATLGSMDATMWQNNERKARFIAAALSGDRSIRTIDDIGEAANQFALAKAIASGDARLMQKAGLESEIARLSRQRAAHFDDQLNIRRRIQTARHEHAIATSRAAQIRIDLERRTPTQGESFTMTWDGSTISDRRIAGNLLLSTIRLAGLSGQTADGARGEIGGFPLACIAGRTVRSSLEASLILHRTEYDQAITIEPDLTPMGLVSRLEHILGRFELDLQEQQRRAHEAAMRLADYEGRLGEPFALQAELDAKEAELKALNEDLAQTGKHDA